MILFLMLLLAFVIAQDQFMSSTSRTNAIVGYIKNTGTLIAACTIFEIILDPVLAALQVPSSCFVGFGLTRCIDLNANSEKTKSLFSIDDYLEDGVTLVNKFCMKCCRPDRRITAVTEIWNMSCPYIPTNVNMIRMQSSNLGFYFKRQVDLNDDTIVQCILVVENSIQYVSGYELAIVITERTGLFGIYFWRRVHNCTVSPYYSDIYPDRFIENISIQNIPYSGEDTSSWYMTLAIVAASTVLIFAIPVYKGQIQGQRCENCGSWLVVLRNLCVLCIVVGCRLRHPSPKVFAAADLDELDK